MTELEMERENLESDGGDFLRTEQTYKDRDLEVASRGRIQSRAARVGGIRIEIWAATINYVFFSR